MNSVLPGTTSVASIPATMSCSNAAVLTTSYWSNASCQVLPQLSGKGQIRTVAMTNAQLTGTVVTGLLSMPVHQLQI